MRTTYQRFRAINERIDIAHMQNNGKRLALLKYALVLIMDEEMEEAQVSAAVLDLQVKPCSGMDDLFRYMCDLNKHAAAEAEQR